MKLDTTTLNRSLISEKQFQLLLDSIPLPAWIFDVDTLQFLQVNNTAINIYGYSREEYLNMSIKDIRPFNEIKLMQETISQTLDNAFHKEGWKHIKKNGSVIFVEIFAKNIDYFNKKARLIVANDITRFKVNDDKLHLNAAIIESSEDAIISKSLDGLITSWNEGAERIYGYSKSEILNKPISILIPQEKSYEFENIMSKIRNGERIDHYQTTRVRKDRSTIVVSVSISPIKDSLKRVVGASTIARDITKLKQMEEERERFIKKEMELKEQTEKVQQRLLFLSESGKILSSSLDYETTFASIAGIPVPFISDWCAIDLIDKENKLKRVAIVHSDADKYEYDSQLQKMFNDDNLEFSEVCEVIRKGKSKIFRNISIENFQEKYFNKDLYQILKSLGFSSLIVVPLKSRDKIFGAITFGMRESNRNYDEDDLAFIEEFASIATLAIDNVMLYKDSQLMNIELENRVKSRTEQLEAANNELETFSYSVSHDLKAPLRAIEGFSKILLEEHAGSLDEEAKRIFNIVISNTSRMSQLIEDLLEFSKITRVRMNKIRIDMRKLVENVFNELKNLENDRQINLELCNLLTADVDPSLMRQVWINLLGNAIKFTRPRAKALIEIGLDVVNGINVYFIKDNGVGFDMKYSQNLFGVFQRLHRYNDFEGTGVGLALVERIIKRHGGRIWAEAKINEGASFYFTLS
jgi:PAS domain S-box-containing protein